MIGLATITHETFLLLRRDRVFVPAVVFGIFFMVLANLASDWSVEDFRKILFDFGAFGYRLTGIAVAIFWATKLVADGRGEGSIELALAAPVGRTTWLIGRYLGLALTLIALAAILLAFWQFFMILNDFGWLGREPLLAFGFLTLEWLVCGALGLFFASFTGHGVALFATAATVLVGLSASLVAFTLTPEHSKVLSAIVSFFAAVWNLQLFNLADMVTTPERFPGSHLLWWRAAYGASAIGILLVGAGISFSRRDVAS